MCRQREMKKEGLPDPEEEGASGPLTPKRALRAIAAVPRALYRAMTPFSDKEAVMERSRVLRREDLHRKRETMKINAERKARAASRWKSAASETLRRSKQASGGKMSMLDLLAEAQRKKREGELAEAKQRQRNQELMRRASAAFESGLVGGLKGSAPGALPSLPPVGEAPHPKDAPPPQEG